MRYYGGINRKQPKIYCVRFNMLKDETIYLEHNLYHYDKDEAVEMARYLISNRLDIHPQRLVLVSVSEDM